MKKEKRLGATTQVILGDANGPKVIVIHKMPFKEISLFSQNM